ncbi:hypothetical protein K438DRAFT_1776066 [Mycena galopus ATCC 62051]|nr:hypothetical protein K438DRAFT_1776066 [Mycena galopus ATCC 62051]
MPSPRGEVPDGPGPRNNAPYDIHSTASPRDPLRVLESLKITLAVIHAERPVQSSPKWPVRIHLCHVCGGLSNLAHNESRTAQNSFNFGDLTALASRSVPGADGIDGSIDRGKNCAHRTRGNQRKLGSEGLWGLRRRVTAFRGVVRISDVRPTSADVGGRGSLHTYADLGRPVEIL